MGGGLGKNGYMCMYICVCVYIYIHTHIYVWLGSFAVHLNLSQHYLLAMPQYQMKMKYQMKSLKLKNFLKIDHSGGRVASGLGMQDRKKNAVKRRLQQFR